MLSEREIATLILVAGLVVLVVTWRDTRKALSEVFRAFFVVKIVVPLFLYLLYALALVVLARWIGVWELAMIKDTIIVIITVAVPLMFGVTNAESGSILVRKVVRETLGVAAIVALYLNLASLSVIAELVIQILVIVATSLSVFAKHQGGKALAVAKLMDGILILIGLGMLTFTTIWVAQNWLSLDLALIGLTAAMSVWLPFLLLPFLYVLAFIAAIELIYMRLPYFNGRQQPPLRVRLAILIGLSASVFWAKRFIGQWLVDAGPLRSFREANALMNRYRAETPKRTAPS